MARMSISILSLLALIVGCASLEDRKRMFVEDRNFDIGRFIYEASVPEPVYIVSNSTETSQYIYEFKNTGCRWVYVVDNMTKKIISWKFDGDPDLCYLEFSGRW